MTPTIRNLSLLKETFISKEYIEGKMCAAAERGGEPRVDIQIFISTVTANGKILPLPLYMIDGLRTSLSSFRPPALRPSVTDQSYRALTKCRMLIFWSLEGRHHIGSVHVQKDLVAEKTHRGLMHSFPLTTKALGGKRSLHVMTATLGSPLRRSWSEGTRAKELE